MNPSDNLTDFTFTFAMISNLTHQAINPLNGVIVKLEIFIFGTIKGKRRDQRLQAARAQLEYTVSLIRNLAYFAQYDVQANPNPKLNTTKTCIIPQLLIEAAQFFQEQAATRHIRFEVTERSVQNAINGDPDLLRQVFMNIFDNFYKYGEESSVVSIKQWIQKSSGDLLITFEGLSIPFDSSEDIFALGVRGKSAKERTSAGSGLGLHICKLIIERLCSGTITASYVHSSQLAKFEVRIPNAYLR